MTSPQSMSQEPSALRMSIYLPGETEVLRCNGILVVTLEYQGQHGERQIGALTFHGVRGAAVAPQVGDSVRNHIEVFLHELLEARFPGWETAEGARGTFEWLVDRDVLEHRHEFRVYAYVAARIPNG
jgi:hypothetical protein